MSDKGGASATKRHPDPSSLKASNRSANTCTAVLTAKNAAGATEAPEPTPNRPGAYDFQSPQGYRTCSTSPDHAFHSRLMPHRQCPRTVRSRLRSNVNCPGRFSISVALNRGSYQATPSRSAFNRQPFGAPPLKAFASFPTLAFIRPSTHANRKGDRISE